MLRQRTIELLSVCLFLALTVFGLFVTIAYYGQRSHLSILLSEEWKPSIQASCKDLGALCGGWHGMGPAIANTFARGAPFLPYLIACLVLFGLFLALRAMNGNPGRPLRLRAWMIVTLFVASVWILFNVLSFGTIDGESPRQIVEPVQALAGSISEEALKALQNNFNDLSTKGCLEQIGEHTSGAGVFRMKVRCIEQAFFPRVFAPLLVLLLFLADVLIVGRALLQWIGIKNEGKGEEALVSAGLGVSALIGALWLLAALHLYVSVAGWSLLLGIPLLCYKQTKYWAKAFVKEEWEVRGAPWSMSVIVGWLLVSYLALNYLTVIRPFPLGWDDLGSYMNRPRLLVSYGTLIPSMGTFQWEYLSSLGFLLFGYQSDFAATVSMEIVWLAGVLAIFALIIAVRTFAGIGGVLAALLYYTLPMVGHFSFADMKIDNGLFFFMVTGAFCLFHALFPRNETTTYERDVRRWLIIAGICFGVGFGVKVTMVMPIMAAFAVLIGASLHWTGFFGFLGVAIIVYNLQGLLTPSAILSRIAGAPVQFSDQLFLLIMAIFASALLVWAAWKGQSKLKQTLIALAIFGGTILLSIAPWILYNNYLHGNLVPRLTMGPPNTYAPLFDFEGKKLKGAPGQDVRTLPKDLAVDLKNPACNGGTANAEELDRYWGTETGLTHYLTLPWRTVMNIDSIGYYVTTSSFLLFFPLLLLLPFFWFKESRWLRWLFAWTCVLIVQWIFLANGVPWYGIGMFLGLCVVGEILVTKAPDILNKSMAGLLLILALLTSFAFRFWQFENMQYVQEYAMGKVSGDVMRERTVGHYAHIADIIAKRRQADPNHPYVYRAGTFIAYFVPKNLEVFPRADNQLDTFNCLAQGNNPKKTLARLKALGFNSIIFDLNTDTIEQDENGTLHKKTARFKDFLLNHRELGIEPIIYDPDAGVSFFLLP